MSKLIFCAIAFLSIEVLAAVPKSQQADHQEALEILGMPAANRKQVATAKDRSFAKKLFAVAFDEKQSMQVRWKALTLGSEVGGLESLPELQKSLEHSAWFIRNAALVSIQNLSSQEGQKAAIKLLSDKALVVRSAAVTALDSNLTAQQRAELWGELDADINFRKKESLWVRGQILEKLAQKPMSKEAPLFVKYLQDSDKRLHPSAVAALEKITGRPADNIPNSLNHKINFWQKWARSKEAQQYY